MALAVLCLPLTGAFGQTVLLHTTYNTVQPRPWQDGEGKWWNRTTTWGVGTWSNLVDSGNQATTIGWQTTAGFTYYFADGPASSGTFDYPDFVSGNGFNFTGVTASGRFSGLDPDKAYTLSFYAAVNLTALVPQQGLQITATGLQTTSEALLLQGSVGQPTWQEVVLENLRPAADGTLTLTFTRPDGYARGSLNAITLTTIPEPGHAALLIVGLGVALWRPLQRRLR